jgi:hypothetical protein
MNDGDIQGAKNILGTVKAAADEAVEVEIQPDKKITEKVLISVGELEAMINAKVRSLSKPRSG